METVKLPASRLAELEQKMAALELQVKHAKSISDAHSHVLDYLMKLLPYKKKLEIFHELKSLSDFYKDRPELLDKEFGRSTAYAQALHELYVSLEFHLHQKTR